MPERTERMTIRFSPQEVAVIERAARAFEIEPSRLCRKLVMDGLDRLRGMNAITEQTLL